MSLLPLIDGVFYFMEIWKDVLGYEGVYQVNELGDVKSLKRNTPGTFTSYDKLLKKGISTKGYYCYRLSKNGKSKNSLLHRLVAIAFIDNPNNEKCVNHKDGNPLNNCISNLEWCSYSYNSLHGYRSNGRKNPMRKLTEVQVSEIKKKLDPYYYGLGVKLAKEYGVSIYIISLIKMGKCYKFVD
jgi:hypothetical protein